jgi:hypothetical protein
MFQHQRHEATAHIAKEGKHLNFKNQNFPPAPALVQARKKQTVALPKEILPAKMVKALATTATATGIALALLARPDPLAQISPAGRPASLVRSGCWALACWLQAL